MPSSNRDPSPQAGVGLPTPQVIKQEVDYDSPYLVVNRAITRMPSGYEATFFLRREADVVVCLPVTDDGRLIMVEEYRPGPGRWLYEIPAGNIDPGEDIADAVAREVLEETGYAGEIVHLCSTWISAYSCARKHIYLMNGARLTRSPTLAPSDLLRVSGIDRTVFEEIVRSGALTDLDAGLLCLKWLDGKAGRS